MLYVFPILSLHICDSLFNQKVHVELEYVTEMEPKITRKKTVSMSIPTSLDLTVNVQDFFRGEKYDLIYTSRLMILKIL